MAVGKRCYAEGDDIAIRGTGFTANAKVGLTLERKERTLVSSADPAADANGVVDGSYQVANETGWLAAEETRFAMTLRLTESPQVAAATTFEFSRWNVGYRGRLQPGRRVVLQAVGFTQAAGKPLYAHYVLRGKRRRTVRLGTLAGPCGDKTVRLRDAFPFRRVPAGRWRIRVNASRTDPNARDTVVLATTVRVPR